jgi:putative membrane protein
MKRNLLDYITLIFKGMAMGAADLVPGVSGGTIAFISGVYEELISSLNAINFSLIKTLRTEGLKSTWKKINGNFLIAIFAGIAISVVSLSKLVSWLLHEKPVLLWAFFFGLVLASVLFVLKKIEQWKISEFLGLFFGTLIAYQFTKLGSLGDSESMVYLFFSGAIAICAMILPGISGAFILVILGSYNTIVQALNDKTIGKLAVFMAGAIVGILSFSKLLKWLFKVYKNPTLAVLTGFMIGAMKKIWPWKKVLSYRLNSKGINVPLNEECVSPFSFDGNPQILFAIALMIFGFLLIFILEKIGSKNENIEKT